jgi:hypothetical protein
MGTTIVYRYVLDNNGSFCVDNNGNLIYIDFTTIVTADAVEVKRVRNRIYPCERCKFYHRFDAPKTWIHSVIYSEKKQLPVLRVGSDQPFVERIGWCEDYKEKSKGG